MHTAQEAYISRSHVQIIQLNLGYSFCKRNTTIVWQSLWPDWLTDLNLLVMFCEVDIQILNIELNIEHSSE